MNLSFCQKGYGTYNTLQQIILYFPLLLLLPWHQHIFPRQLIFKWLKETHSCWKSFPTLSKLTCLYNSNLFLFVIYTSLYIETEHLFKKRRLKLPPVYCQNYLLPRSIMCDLLGTCDQVLSPSGTYFLILSLILLDINSVYWELSLSVVSWHKVLLSK